MTLLRRVLKLQAVVWTLGALPEIVAPRWFLVTLFGQPEYPDYAYVRSMGVACVGLAMMMVLVAQHVSETWWWAWLFALVSSALATVCGLTAMFGTPEGTAVAYWWILAAANVAFAVALLIGLARAGQEQPIV
jgi:hypothetical protein